MEFSGAYLEIREKLKFLIQGQIEELEFNKSQKQKFEKMMIENKNESLSKEGLSKQASFNFDILGITFTNPLFKEFQKLMFKIVYNNITKSTQQASILGSDVQIYESLNMYLNNIALLQN